MTEGPAPNLSGRVAVVTGATSGIGKEVARGLARMGATTVVVGRGPDRAARVAKELAQATGNPHVESVAVVDLAELADTRALAETILGRYANVHILVNNAGAYFHRREITPDGLERTFALNVLSPYALTSLLVPNLRASAPARVVNVSSAAHEGARVDFADLQFTRKFSGFRVYGASKLELLWWTREFARRLQGSGVTVNAVHPGFVRSGFGRNNGGGTAIGLAILETLFARSVVRGADTPTWAASAPELTTVTGGYFADRQPRPGSEESRDLEKARRLVDECARLSGVPAPNG